jgi:hypothetical protein
MAGTKVIRHPQNRGKGAALRTGFGALNIPEIPKSFTAEAQRHRERPDRYCFTITKDAWGRWT